MGGWRSSLRLFYSKLLRMGHFELDAKKCVAPKAADRSFPDVDVISRVPTTPPTFSIMLRLPAAYDLASYAPQITV